MTTIAVGTTQTTGYVASIDNSGNLVFQTNGTTTAMTLDTSQNANIVGGVTAATANIIGNTSIGGTLTLASANITGNSIVNGILTVNTNSSTTTAVMKNGTSSISFVTSNTGLGSSFLGITDGSTNIFGVAKYGGNTSNTSARLGINYAVSDMDGTTEFCTVGSKKTPVIELNSNDGSISLIGESGSGSNYRTPTHSSGLKITSAGYALKPSMPSFAAYFAGSNPLLTSATVVPYSSTHWNTGSCFNTSTYRFTAPVAGKYFFHAMVNAYDIAAGSWLRLLIRKNGNTEIIGTYIYSGGTSDQNIEGSVIQNMSAGDYADVYFMTNDTSYSLSAGTPWQRFEGYLIG